MLHREARVEPLREGEPHQRVAYVDYQLHEHHLYKGAARLDYLNALRLPRGGHVRQGYHRGLKGSQPRSHRLYAEAERYREIPQHYRYAASHSPCKVFFEHCNISCPSFFGFARTYLCSLSIIYDFSRRNIVNNFSEFYVLGSYSVHLRVIYLYQQREIRKLSTK